jgi:hypothetical protein
MIPPHKDMLHWISTEKSMKITLKSFKVIYEISNYLKKEPWKLPIRIPKGLIADKMKLVVDKC